MGELGYLVASVPLRLANAATTIVLPILAVQQVNDIALGGGLVAASLAPGVLVAPLIGTVLDRTRHPRRWMMAAAVATAVALATASLLGTVPLPLILLMLVIGGVANPFYMGGMSSFVTDAIADERRAYAQDSLSYNVATVGGPALAALVITLTNARVAVLVIAAAALVGTGALIALHFQPRPRRDDENLGRDLLAAAQALTRHRPLAAVTAAGTVSQLGAGALPIVAVAISVKRVGDADQAAWIVTAFALGALVGSLLFAIRPLALRPEMLMTAGYAFTGVATLGAIADLGMPVVIVVIALAGVGVAPSNAAMLQLRKQQSTPRVRSQVFTVGAGLRTAASALGAAALGQLAGAPPELLTAIVALVWIASAAIMLGYPRGAEPVEEVLRDTA